MGAEIGASGQAYLRAIRLRGINPDVVYFDPDAPAPLLEAEVEQPADPQADSTDPSPALNRMFLIALAAVGLIWIAMLARGGGSAGLFARLGQNPATGQGKRPDQPAPSSDMPLALAGLRRLGDPRQALILLAQTALARAVADNGMIWQRSWTARDALARLPQDQPHLAALRALVMDSERAHYGGQAVSDQQFTDHANRIAPLLYEVPV